MVLLRPRPEHEAEPAPPADRARHLVRTPRVCRLGAAIERAGSSKCAVARGWGVDERIVRDVCAGLRPLDEQRLDALPASVAIAFHSAAIERRQENMPTPNMPPERHLAVISRRFSELVCDLTEAIADETFTPEEKRGVLKRIRAEIAVLQAFEREIVVDLEAGK